MYFNRRVLFASVVLASQHGAEAGDCGQDIVKAASDKGFLQYVLVNCVAKANTSALTIKDKTLVDPQTCLVNFELATGVALTKAAPKCLAAYNAFITAVANDAVKKDNHNAHLNKSPFELAATSSSEGCDYDSTKDQILMSYVCWNRLSERLTAFQQVAGYPIFIQPCDASFIRDITKSKIIQKTFTDVLSAASGDLKNFGVSDFRLVSATQNGSGHIVVPGWKLVASKYMNDNIDLKTGMCYGAIQTVLDMIQGSESIAITNLGVTFGVYGVNGGSGGPSSWNLADLQTACKADITAPACANSQLLTGVKSLYTSLTGYDMQFSGPLCTADKITSLDTSLTPTPFQFFTKCGLFSSDFAVECSQDSLNNYMLLVNSTVGSECKGCFVGLSNDIKALASNATVKAVCNSTAVFSGKECVAVLSDVTAKYKDCTGSSLNTGVGTIAPVTPPEEDDTDDIDDEDDTDDTDDEDANDATRIMMSSGTILLVAVMTYLM